MSKTKLGRTEQVPPITPKAPTVPPTKQLLLNTKAGVAEPATGAELRTGAASKTIKGFIEAARKGIDEMIAKIAEKYPGISKVAGKIIGLFGKVLNPSFLAKPEIMTYCIFRKDSCPRYSTYIKCRHSHLWRNHWSIRRCNFIRCTTRCS